MHCAFELDVLCIGRIYDKYVLSYRMAEHDEHFIGPEESGESVHHQGHDHGYGQGQAFGVDDQQNVPHHINHTLGICKGLDHLPQMKKFL